LWRETSVWVAFRADILIGLRCISVYQSVESTVGSDWVYLTHLWPSSFFCKCNLLPLEASVGTVHLQHIQRRDQAPDTRLRTESYPILWLRETYNPQCRGRGLTCPAYPPI